MRQTVRWGPAPAAVLTAALVATVSSSCGASGGSVADHDGPPPTDRDPLPYVPSPSERPSSGAVVGVAQSGGYDQARSVAIRLITAVRDADEATLTRVLDDPLGSSRARLTTPNRSRADIVQRILVNPRRSGLGPEIPLEHLVEVRTMNVVPLSRHQPDRALPSGFYGSDLIVTFPLAAQGRRYLTPLLGWGASASVVVRPGVEPVVIAL